ncbi:MAG: TonB-dependent receptor [Betaproteobacteria bacterium]|nr:TonB-dependent receptor [Betaproteobacteria bacterium]
MPGWVRICLTCLLGLIQALVWAQTQSESLKEMVVSGSRTETKLSETPVSIGAVSQETWNADKAKSVGEIINRIPGVFWNDLGNEQHSMGIRQPISTNAVYQYLEDGIPIRPLGVFNHNALNETNMNGSGGVEVVKGAASSLYGSNAVGGAVNFLTLEPSRTPTGYVGLRGDGIQGYSRLDTGASNTWGDLGLRFSHYSSYREHDNWQTYSGGKKDSVTVRGDYNLGLSSWLKATLVQTNLESDMTGSVFENDYRSNPGKSINTFTWRKDKTTRANVSWEGETTANGLTTVTAFARNNDHGQLPSYTITTCTVAAACPTGVKGTINNNHVESVGVDIKHVQELTTLQSRLVSGVYIDRSQNDYVSDNLSVTTAGGRYVSYVLNNTANPTGVRDYGVGIANDALFAQWEYAPSEAWRLVAGGRYDSISYDFKNNLTPNANDPNFGAHNEVRSFAKFSPKLGATYAVDAVSSLYGNLSRGFTPPEVSQLYGKSAIPDLTAATYENREVGWRTLLAQGIRLDSALYQLSGENTIVSYTITPGNSENRNAGKTRSEGLELALSQQLQDWDWYLSTNLAKHTYVAYKLSASEDYSGKTMPQAPNHTVNAQVGWKLTPASRVALGMVHQSHYWMNNLNTVSYDGHTLWNLNATHQLFNNLELWGQIRNLEDKRYSDSASSTYKSSPYTPNTQNSYTPGAPRSFMVGLTWNLK